MRLRNLVIQLLAALLIIGGAIGVGSAWPERPQFAYEAVEQAVREQVGKPVGRLTREELGKVTSLRVPDGLIQDLTWVSALPNLSHLILAGEGTQVYR